LPAFKAPPEGGEAFPGLLDDASGILGQSYGAQAETDRQQ
jgi:hypothetical protein